MGGTHKLAGGTKEGGTYQGMERKRTEREEEGKGETVFWGQACGGEGGNEKTNGFLP